MEMLLLSVDSKALVLLTQKLGSHLPEAFIFSRHLHWHGLEGHISGKGGGWTLDLLCSRATCRSVLGLP